MPPRAILLVDDSDAVRVTLAAFLEDLGHTVVQAASLATARAELAAAQFEIVVADLHLPDGRGTALLAELRASHPAAARVLLTGDTIDGPLDAADLVVAKGVDPDQLGELVERAIAAHR